MNDLMTKSFLSYVDLKKQATKNLEARPDLETAQQQHLDPEDSKNLSKFFDDVNAIKADMEEISYLQVDLRDLHESTKSALSPKILRGLRDRINSDMVMVLRKAKLIKTKLERLDESNVSSRMARTGFPRRPHKDNGDERAQGETEGHDERFSESEAKIIDDDDDVRDESREAVNRIQRSLVELHKVFLDMAAMVEVQGEKTNDIEANVSGADRCVNGTAGELGRAGRMWKWRRSWACWVGVAVLVLLLVCLVAVLF